jgi:dipeptidase D
MYIYENSKVMMSTVSQLEPVEVWDHFYQITRIPRPSGYEQKIIDYLVKFAWDKKLDHQVDQAGNLIIRKKASPGKEKSKGVILQSHVDMVPQKNSDKQHDFKKDPIEALIDGEWVRANRTTLGADNGIGMAVSLAVLGSETISHGPLEALFTISEETGMDGAFGLKKDALHGKIMLNLDSEEEGELFIGCAGGVDINISGHYGSQECNDREAFRIKLEGLNGGHSGIDINLGRGNANLDLLRLLQNLGKKSDINLISFSGGNLRNAIPREAEAVISIDRSSVPVFKEDFAFFSTAIKNAYGSAEKDLHFRTESAETSDKCMNKKDQEHLLELILSSPNGVIKMSATMPDVVQTSNNTAVVNISEGNIDIKMLLRSSSDAEKEEYGKIISKHFSAIGVKTELKGAYPGWLPDNRSDILRIAERSYRELFGKEPKVKVIHAGLECGIIGSKYPGLDMISFGPTIKHPHSPDEKVHIESVGRFWEYLKKILEKI